jgi:hypothetical protein
VEIPALSQPGANNVRGLALHPTLYNSTNNRRRYVFVIGRLLHPVYSHIRFVFPPHGPTVRPGVRPLPELIRRDSRLQDLRIYAAHFR